MGIGVWVGIACGVTTTCAVNSIRHLSVLRNPWEHVGMATAFGFLGYYHDKYLPFLREKSRQKEHERGLDGPLVHVPWETENWLDRPPVKAVPPAPKN
eukprot:CAMPEP_0201490798 /NCGR_PEP_ID=MMETSP0151_2-20130828/27540_1 /ASSEMBLY_ACC=CAM_ASM_000257 /TAXON_ID=200890 /ORGANISM="Paramoeba atlantica, Strain 621/1 / CCAP 1560/9" /LENGTH=97 /DNA_ID=CAMNT_0047876899 /DNA_START=14 /DNA_END=307 /DNA_ORIENTATION=+